MRQGFTLIELLVVVSIIAILAALLLPAIGLVQSGARQLACCSNQRQIGLGMASYGADNYGFLPMPKCDAGTWDITLLSYLDAGQTDGTGPVPLYRCPFDRGEGRNGLQRLSYVYNTGDRDISGGIVTWAVIPLRPDRAMPTAGASSWTDLVLLTDVPPDPAFDPDRATIGTLDGGRLMGWTIVGNGRFYHPRATRSVLYMDGRVESIPLVTSTSAWRYRAPNDP